MLGSTRVRRSLKIIFFSLSFLFPISNILDNNHTVIIMTEAVMIIIIIVIITHIGRTEILTVANLQRTCDLTFRIAAATAATTATATAATTATATATATWSAGIRECKGVTVMFTPCQFPCVTYDLHVRLNHAGVMIVMKNTIGKFRLH